MVVEYTRDIIDVTSWTHSQFVESSKLHTCLRAYTACGNFPMDWRPVDAIWLSCCVQASSANAILPTFTINVGRYFLKWQTILFQFLTHFPTVGIHVRTGLALIRTCAKNSSVQIRMCAKISSAQKFQVRNSTWGQKLAGCYCFVRKYLCGKMPWAQKNMCVS